MSVSEISVFYDNLQNEYIKNILSLSDDSGLVFEQSLVRITAEWMGYNLNEENFVDGAGDRGIDFWYASDTSFDIFQVKCHELDDNNKIPNLNFDSKGVNDLTRIKSYLISSDGGPDKNTKLRKLKERWTYVSQTLAMDTSKDNEERIINARLCLIVIGPGLTEQANAELEALKKECEEPILLFGNTYVQFKVFLYTLQDIIEIKWRERNQDWKDINGKKQDSIELHPEDIEKCLDGSKSAVFYCRLIDLVQAYKKFGYQIFEPNVRCNIRKSKINAAIKESIAHPGSRKEFRFLNNGVTITCKSYTKPKNNKPFFIVSEPGIVNGLQTVVAVSEAYEDLSDAEKRDFESNCYVLVRLLMNNAVRKIEQVVRTTNNQNKMEPRNLLSNNPEQILYERLFSELGWFYERKQGAWEAFCADPARWRTLNGKRKTVFLVNPSVARSKARVVDNEEIAQAWLSFVGFSNLAVHEKTSLFELDDRYQFLFLHRPQKHGAETEFQLSELKEYSINAAPSHELMLIAFLARRFAKEMTPSPKDNFNDACERKKINPLGKSRDEIIQKLIAEDSDYLLNSVLGGMSFTFVEFLGYILFKALGEKVYDIGSELLSNGTLAYLKTNFSFVEIKEMVEKEDFKSDDILCVAWYSFKHVLGEMLGGAWSESYRTANNKSRFIAEKQTRERFIKGIEEVNRYTCKAQYTKLWSAGIKPPVGFFGYIKDCLMH